MSMNIQYMVLTEDNFQSEVLAAQALVLVDCWASWCSSFQPINPLLNELPISITQQIKVGRLNIAVSAKLADDYRIRAVPTLLVFRDGQVLERIVGGVAQPVFVSKLSALLADHSSRRSRIACL
jgi:thioredoxin 1